MVQNQLRELLVDQGICIGKSRFFSIVFFCLLALAADSRAAWMKLAGPDSIRILDAKTIVYGGDVRTDAILTGRRDTIYSLGVPNPGNRLNVGGNVSAVAVSGGSCFAATSKGQVLRRSGCASDWVAGSPVPDSASIRALLFTGTLLVGTSNGIFSTTQILGGSWTALNTGLANLSVRALMADGPSLYALTDSGLFRSTNSGANWSFRGRVHPKASMRTVVLSGSRFFAATDSGVYKSQDSGITWTAANTGLPYPDAYAFTDTGTSLFVGTAGGLFRTTNGGASWAAVDSLTSPIYAISRTGEVLYVGKNDGIWMRMLSQVVAVNREGVREKPRSFIKSRNRLEFFLPTASRVLLEVHDLEGKKVTTLLDARFPAGAHEQVLFPALAQGVYLYQLKIGEAFESRLIPVSR